MDERTLYVLMMASESELGSPLDACQGVFTGLAAAQVRAEAILAEERIEGDPDNLSLEWWEPEALSGSRWVLHNDATGYAFAAVEVVELERRIEGDRRGSGR